MNCQECQNESDKYHGGKLSDDLRIQVETHLRECTECAESYRIDSFIEFVISQEKTITPNNNLSANILKAIETLEDPHSKISYSFRRVLQPTMIITSLAAAIFIGVLIGNIYKPSGTIISRPVEMAPIDDAAIESVYILSNE